MSTYVYMRILESAPARYDLGIRLLSLGRIEQVYDTVARLAVPHPAARVLEIGCGTGNLTSRLLERGAVVTALDQNPDMLAIARKKLRPRPKQLELLEMTAVEIADRFPAESFEAVASTLVLSEMSEDERRYVLEAAYGVLCPGGRLVLADEVRHRSFLRRFASALVRWPLAVLTYLLTQTTTRPLRDLGGLVREAGFFVVEERRVGGLAIVVAERPREAA